MEIIVHRGTHQIGGCVTEIRTDKTRIFIDMGSQLPDECGHSPEESLSIKGVTYGDCNCDGIFFTHYHGDHIGMLSGILPNIPLYMGQASKEIYTVLQNRINPSLVPAIQKINTFSYTKKIAVGDIIVTPYLVDHSAYDAYMFLIEAEGKRILHTGDFRTHGFRGKGVIPMLKKYIGSVDILIVEGTTLSRDDSSAITEPELKESAKKLLESFKYVFVVCSSTNIDRIAAFNQVTPIGKYFFCDQYQKEVLEIARKYGEKYSSLYSFNKVTTYGKNLESKAEKQGFCMMVRGGNQFLGTIRKYRELHNSECLVVYSMWDGYLKILGNTLAPLMEGFQNVEHLHSSGHATYSAILEVCNAVSPKQAIIPIHTTNSGKLEKADFPFHIEHLSDGEIYKIA